MNLTIFKGFLPSSGKVPKKKYKDLDTFDDFKSVENENSFVGILKDDLIQVDIDNKNEAEILFTIISALNLKCNVIETSRGKHFYFKNRNLENRCQGKYNALGIKMDIGLGDQNAAIPLKVDGKLRSWIRECDFNETSILPVWLIPITNKQYIDFSTLNDGDGRNSKLFSYILSLQKAGLTKNEIRESIAIINKYVMNEPIEDKELEVILRDESFKKLLFFNGKKFDHDNFSKLFLEEHRVIKYNNNLFMYHEGVYNSDPDVIKQAMIKIYNKITSTQLNEVIERLKLIVPKIKYFNSDKIALRNGLYDIKTKTIEEFNPDYISFNKIDVDYNSAAYSRDLDKALNEICCNDKNLRLLIEEMIGSCLYTKSEFNAAFFLVGQGSNGKSTILDLIRNLIGSENISSVPLQDFDKNFKAYQLMNKLANIGDDIDKSALRGTGMFKKLVTGETVNVERKGKDPFDFNNYATMFFSSNHAVTFDDTSHGINRRIKNIPFKAKFVKGINADYTILDRIRCGDEEFLQYTLKIALEGLDRLINNKDYTNSKLVDIANEEFEENNNPILAFLKENYYQYNNYDKLLENSDVLEHSTLDVFGEYRIWCIETNNKFDIKLKNFTSEVNKITGFTTKQKRIKAAHAQYKDDKKRDRYNIWVKN